MLPKCKIQLQGLHCQYLNILSAKRILMSVNVYKYRYLYKYFLWYICTNILYACVWLLTLLQNRHCIYDTYLPGCQESIVSLRCPSLLNKVQGNLPFIVFNMFPVNVQEIFVWSSEGNSTDVHRDATNYLMKEIIFKKESYGRKRACLFTRRSKQLSYELMLNI